jgi:predicted SAM-dependent methyltransferase
MQQVSASENEGTPMKFLNLGCGNRFNREWVNVDTRASGEGVITCDLLSGLQFADESFDVIYHSHLLEHLPKSYAPIFIRECFRILKPYGIIRVVVPDLERLARTYLDLLDGALKEDEKARSRYDWIIVEMLDQMVRHRSGGEMLDYWRQDPMPAEDFVIERVGPEVINARKALRKTPGQSSSSHEQAAEKTDADGDEAALKVGRFRLSGEVHQWMYDRYSLSELLKKAGFHDVRQCRADESLIPDFNRYGLDLEPDGSVRKPDSLFMEAVKPA